MVEAGNRCSAGARTCQLDLADVLADQLEPVEHRRGSDDRSAVLVVMEDRNLHALPQRALDVETFRGLDVLEVDPPEGRLEARHDLNQLVRVPLVDFDVEHVDASKFLEQTGLSLHYRLAGERTDIAQTEHGGAVGDHRHQVGARGKRRRLVRIIPDGKARIGNARRIGERQVALIHQALGRRDGDFSRTSERDDIPVASRRSCSSIMSSH